MPLWQRRGLQIKSRPTLSISKDVKQEQVMDRSKSSLTQDFSVVGTIGQGTSSYVQHAIRKSDGHHVALKTMRTVDPEMISFARAEFDMLSKVEHPNIVRALDFIVEPGRVVVVLDYFD